MAEIFKPTKLLWDDYIDYLIMEIINSNFSKRAENKPMATPKGPDDSHLTSRFMHEILVSLIAKRIAKELNLNEKYAYTGMLGHDAGHPFSAHEGEVIFDTIGRIYNIGYFHHNAKGVEVILSDDICNKAIDRIPDIENNPELRKKLQEEFYSFLDIVISHDGEATQNDAEKKVVSYPSKKEAVLTKLEKANSENNYKFIAQDIEGRLGKVADVLAYLATDIQDGFRLGFINDFNEDYLEAFGAMFSENDFDEDYLEDFGAMSLEQKKLLRKKNINIGKSVLYSIKKDQLIADMSKPDNQKILKYVEETIEEAQQEADNRNLKLSDVLNDKYIEKRIASIEESIRNSEKNWNNEKEQMLMSDMNKYREFMTNMIRVSTNVVNTLTKRMQDYFISDLIKNSKDTGKLGFSKKAEKLFYKMKELNYQYIVQNSRWDYQTEVQPKAAKQLVDLCKSGLIKSGTIRDMFYDSSIKDSITDSEALSYMKTPIRKEANYQKYKKKINKPHVKKHRYKKDKKLKQKLKRKKLIGNVIDYTREKRKIFAIIYMNVFKAIPYTVRENVECALNKEIKCKDYLQDWQRESNENIRNRMLDLYGTINETEKHKEEFIQMLIEEERQKMEEKLAIQLAINYLSGMTDRSFNNLIIRAGYEKRKTITDSKRGGKISSNVQGNLKALINNKPSQDGEDGHDSPR